MCLAGENGCGKSTLVKIISGVYTKDEGEVTFEGKKISKITPAEATQLGIQVIYQDLSIFPNLTVMENLAINSEITAGKKLVNKKRWEATAKEALSKICLLYTSILRTAPFKCRIVLSEPEASAGCWKWRPAPPVFRPSARTVRGKR